MGGGCSGGSSKGQLPLIVCTLILRCQSLMGRLRSLGSRRPREGPLRSSGGLPLLGSLYGNAPSLFRRRRPPGCKGWRSSPPFPEGTRWDLPAVQHVLHAMKSGKAVGLDGWALEELRLLPPPPLFSSMVGRFV